MRGVTCFALIVVAALVAGCAEGGGGVYSSQIPDPQTEFITTRDRAYAMLQGGPIPTHMRVLITRIAVRSYARGLENKEQFMMHLSTLDYPDGSLLATNAYRLKKIITWLRREEIDLVSADQALGELYDDIQQNM